MNLSKSTIAKGRQLCSLAAEFVRECKEQNALTSPGQGLTGAVDLLEPAIPALKAALADPAPTPKPQANRDTVCVVELRRFSLGLCEALKLTPGLWIGPGVRDLIGVPRAEAERAVNAAESVLGGDLNNSGGISRRAGEPGSARLARYATDEEIREGRVLGLRDITKKPDPPLAGAQGAPMQR